MINHKKHKGGYVGLLLLLIGVAIVTYLMVTQYESMGFVPKSTGTQTETGTGTDTGTGVGASQNVGGSAVTNPLQRAQNAKNLIEARDRSMMEGQ